MSLDEQLYQAKRSVTEMVCLVVSGKRNVEDLAGSIDQLNQAWDALTERLVEQREARDRTIAWLHSEIAALRQEKRGG